MTTHFKLNNVAIEDGLVGSFDLQKNGVEEI
jgi:hypothetical protein